MLRVETYSDAQLALSYLQQQSDSTRDPRLRELLELRVVRLQGLINLRAAKRRYEEAHGPMVSLEQLVVSGELTAMPEDPLQLGYELRDGEVQLKKLQVGGVGE